MILLNRRKYIGVRRNPDGAPLDIADATVTVAESVQYTGSPCTPSVTVTYDGATLVANTDYFVAYNDNVNIGAATVVVTGTGSFTGSAVKTFFILPAPSGSPWSFDVSGATEVTTQNGNTVSSGSVPFCVRGGYLFSSQGDGKVIRWSFDGAISKFSRDSSIITASNGGPYGFCMSRDGFRSYMYVKASSYSASGVDTVYMYSHATAWDVSDASAGYGSHNIKMPYVVPKSGTSDVAVALDIDLTGKKIFSAMASGLLHVNSLTTPFDVTSAVESDLSTVDLATAVGVTGVAGMQVSPDGKKLILITSSGVIYMFGLSLAWDVSTIDASSERTFDTGLSGVCGIGVSVDATKVFVKQAGVKVYAVS